MTPGHSWLPTISLLGCLSPDRTRSIKRTSRSTIRRKQDPPRSLKFRARSRWTNLKRTFSITSVERPIPASSASIISSSASRSGRSISIFQPIRLRQQCMGCHESFSRHNDSRQRWLAESRSAAGRRFAGRRRDRALRRGDAKCSELESGDPDRHGHHHILRGDDHRVCHRALCDRQAAQAPPRRERRGQPRQCRSAGRHPHRR